MSTRFKNTYLIILFVACLATTVFTLVAQSLPTFSGFGSTKQPMVRATSEEEIEMDTAAAKRAWLFLQYPQLSLMPEPPPRGTFYSLQKVQPPLPFLPIEGLPIYSWGEGNYFYDDLDYRYPLRRSDGLARRSGGVMEMSGPGVPGGGEGGGTNETGGGSSGPSANDYSTNTTDLWLEINPAFPNFNLALHNTEERAFYRVWSSDSLLTNSWIEESYLLGTLSTNRTETLIDPLGWTNLFFRAVKDVKNVQIDIPSSWLHTNVFSPVVNGGPATSMTILVNSTNIGSAVWTNFTRAPSVTLGSSNGTYQVWFGFALPDGTTNWIKREITVDTVPPTIVIVGPTPGTVSKPVIQLTGYTIEPVSVVKFDLSNGAGTITNLTGYITDQFLDTNSHKFTTNWFQCYDVHLTNGSNTITLHGTDLAGNVTTTNLTYTLSTSGDTTAPVITVDWPTNQALLSGSQFSINGQIDDESAGIAAEIVSNGETNQFGGLVERNGKFWLSGLPVGTNGSAVKLVASDAAGNKRTNSFTVLRSDISTTITPVPAQELTLPTVSLEGTVSDTNVTVYVNGLEAMIDGNSWSISNVPITTTGTASFIVTTHPNGSSPSGDSGDRLNQNIPSKIRLESYSEAYSAKLLSTAGGLAAFYDAERIRDWKFGQGGVIHAKNTVNGSGGNLIEGPWPDENILVSPNIVWESCLIEPVFRYTAPCEDTFPGCVSDNTSTVKRVAQARISLVAGKSVHDVVRIIRLTARVSERTLNFAASYVPFLDYPLDAVFGDLPVAPNRIKILGQSLTPTSTNALVGELFVQFPAGSVVDVTPVTIPIRQYFYTFDVQAEDVKLELEWAAADDNLPIEDNINPITNQPMPGGGKRIFVGAKTPSETSYRNTVKLKIKSVPPVPTGTVYLKSFDVDDPTSPLFDNTTLIDPNGPIGNDNYTNTSYVIQREGFFTNSSVSLGTNGEAEAAFTVGVQPGNNYRVAATFYPSELVALQVTDLSKPTFVTANDQPMSGFSGMVSPMLTVWRKLHLEVDSMEAVATNGTEKNFIDGTVNTYSANQPSNGVSTITIGNLIPDLDNVYENGRVEIAGESPFKVLSNVKGFGFDIIVFQGLPTTNVVGKAFKLYDDDDSFLAELGLPPLLPYDQASTNVVGEIRNVFFPAYIDIANANAEGLNPNRRIAFQKNAEISSITGNPFDEFKDVVDSPKFWAHTITFGYQTKLSEDGDSDSEAPTQGITAKSYSLYDGGISAIYLETIRDIALRGGGILILDTNNYPVLRRDFTNQMSGIVAHEIAHAPGGQSADDDHAELGIMHEEGLPINNSTVNPNKFEPATIRRIRRASQWSK